MAGSEQKEKIIRFYKGTEGAETAVKLVDLAEQVKRSQKFRLSGFLDPYGQEIAETIAANYPGIRVDFHGGYHGAERQRAMFIDEAFGGNPDFNIVVIKASWNGQFEHIGHRDVLGALMGQGIERDRIGDIIMGTYLLDNLTQIGHSGVSCVLDDLSNIAPKEERCKEIRATVASLRVDSIAASGYGTSRSHAAADIAADKLRLNWQPVKNAAQAVKEGDVLSMRGRGRVEVVEIKGQTKKGRTVVVLKRYI